MNVTPHAMFNAIPHGTVLKPALAMLGASLLLGCGSSSSVSDGASGGPSAGGPAPAQAASTAIAIDGSSTVFPITDEVVQRLRFERADAPQIDLAVSGTSGGFRKFCAGETQISNASRPITREEMAACDAAGVEYIELPVAFDALTVVTHGENDWAEDITLEELQRLWEPAAEGQVTRWNQVRSDWPDQPIALYGPGQDSGTYDYFNEVVLADAGESRQDYFSSEDDFELVEKVTADPNALAYFGYAYFSENEKALNALGIDAGEGPVQPSRETVRSGDYQPLARPLFIYVNAAAADQNPELQAFVAYYLGNARGWVRTVGYEPLPDEVYALALERLEQRKLGSVFDGTPQPGLTIEELLEKEASS